MRRSLFALALVAAVSASACGSAAQSPSAAGSAPAASGSVPTSTPSIVATSTYVPSPSASPVPDDTVWLCKPGLAANPCESDLTSTSIDAAGKLITEPASSAKDPPIDCFYVYPTVSRQKTVQANLIIDEEERGVAIAQAARFSQVCRVYAPMYPQLTLAAIADPSKIGYTAYLSAYSSVAASFDHYLANYNHGRGIVFIGHSQGAMMLTGLLKWVVDPNPQTRKLLVSALLMGGNVKVPVGTTVGGDFKNIPTCSSATQTGCVVAYSSFDTTPPANAAFGRIATAINADGGSSTGLQIACVNPAAPGGGTATLRPYYPTAGLQLFLGKSAPTLPTFTPFVVYPNQYSAHCMNAAGAQWLQIDRIGGASDKRPVATPGAASWGLHTVDVNIALGNLVELVGSEAAAYR